MVVEVREWALRGVSGCSLRHLDRERRRGFVRSLRVYLCRAWLRISSARWEEAISVAFWVAEGFFGLAARRDEGKKGLYEVVEENMVRFLEGLRNTCIENGERGVCRTTTIPCLSVTLTRISPLLVLMENIRIGQAWSGLACRR